MRKCRGVALITAMLVVTAATLAAVAMTTELQLDIRRTGNLLDNDQARQYALGAERWAGAILRQDRRDSPTDHPGEDWAQVLPALPIEGGALTGAVTDLQGRFNLNNVIVDGKLSEPDVKILRRLLEQAELDPGVAEAVADWIDTDHEVRFPGGAEDDWYLAQTPASRAANAPFASVTELRAVRGLTAEGYAKLAPLVTALPARTAINVNTAPAGVLQALADGLDATTAATLIEERGDDGFLKVEEFLALDALAGLGLVADGLAVKSDWFEVRVLAQVMRGRAELHSLVQRSDAGEINVRARAHGEEL